MGSIEKSCTGRCSLSDSSLSGHGATATAIKANIERLQEEIAKLETLMASQQIEFQAALERDRAEQLMAGLVRMTADLMSAREAVARLKDELIALRSLRSSRPWWWRMLTGTR
jgi:hypothetical protein